MTPNSEVAEFFTSTKPAIVGNLQLQEPQRDGHAHRVSRTFPYHNEQACGLVQVAGGAARADASTGTNGAAVEATWRERALNAEKELHRGHSDIPVQWGRIGELVGQIRDLEADLPPDGVQQLLTETHTLKAQAHRLGQDNRRLEERLAGARDNNRFLDKRLAGLEAQLAEDRLSKDAGNGQELRR